MAQSPSQPGGDGGADFVNRIVTDAKNVPDVMRLYGYLGASSEDGHERLYLSPDLANYVEVPATAILHRMPIAKEQDPHGAVVLWVRRDAALKSKMAPAAAALAQYFAGAMQSAAAAAGLAAAPAAAAPSVAQGPCHPTTPACTPIPQICGHTPIVPCATLNQPCPTHPGYPSCAAVVCTPATCNCTPHTCNAAICQSPFAGCTAAVVCGTLPPGCRTVPAVECATHASACPPCVVTAPAPACVPNTAGCGGSIACGVGAQPAVLPQAAALPAAGYTQGCYLPPTPAYSCGCYHTWVAPCQPLHQLTPLCTMGGACYTVVCA